MGTSRGREFHLQQLPMSFRGMSEVFDILIRTRVLVIVAAPVVVLEAALSVCLELTLGFRARPFVF